MSVEEKIIKLLENEEYISGEKIAEKLSLSRTAIWKHIKKLKDRKYIIESKPKLGYKLVRKTDLLLPTEIKNNLKTSLLGKVIAHFDEVDSTQEVAKKMARKGIAEGALVISEQQHSGRGRLGRRWVSPAGGVWLSLILRPKILVQQAQRITLVVSVAAARAFNKLYDINARIKWPNDILVKGKKICGILIETEGELDKLNFMVIGMGANINISLESEDEIKNIATSVKSQLNREVPRLKFVQTFLAEFEQLYKEFNSGFFKEILKEWLNLSDTIGTRITAESLDEKFEGIVLGLDDDGFLIVRLQDDSEKKVISGDIMHKQL